MKVNYQQPIFASDQSFMIHLWGLKKSGFIMEMFKWSLAIIGLRGGAIIIYINVL